MDLICLGINNSFPIHPQEPPQKSYKKLFYNSKAFIKMMSSYRTYEICFGILKKFLIN